MLFLVTFLILRVRFVLSFSFDELIFGEFFFSFAFVFFDSNYLGGVFRYVRFWCSILFSLSRRQCVLFPVDGGLSFVELGGTPMTLSGVLV